MNIPIFELGIGRAAILAWRDEATLSAIGLLHEASSRAMKVLEDQMDAVAVVNATTRAEAFARDIVRPAMRALVGQAADDWFNAQARALRQVDARLEALALRFAAMGERPSLPLDEVIAGWVPPAWLRGPAHKVGSAIEGLSSDVR